MTDQWTEKLRRQSCANTGIVSLSQDDGDQTPTVLSIPDGFKVFQRRPAKPLSHQQNS
jgi:hypothetical protein